MSRDRRFDIHELLGADDGGSEADLGQALVGARAIESALSGPDPMPGPQLADRIMVAVAREPAPHALGILAVLRRRPGLGGFVESLRLAWSRAFHGTGRPLGLRAGALAYVAAVLLLTVSLSGVAAYATAGALGLFQPNATQRPDATQVLATPAPIQTPSTTEPPATEPAESEDSEAGAEPSETPEASEDESGDDGSSGGSGGSGEDSGDYSGGDDDGHSGDGESGSDDSQTPEPTGTPRASQTPRPSATPEVDSGSDD
jgi:hypothetical protein